jgi:hypothetical protein
MRVVGAMIGVFLETLFLTMGAGSQEVKCGDALMGVKTDAALYSLGDSVKIVFAVKNRCSNPVTFTFPTAKIYDIWIRRGEDEFFRLSSGKMYAQTITTLTIAGGETRYFEHSWDQKGPNGNPVGPGTYTVNAQLLPIGFKPPVVQARFTIGNTKMAVPTVSIEKAIKHYDRLKDRKVQICGVYKGWKPDPDDPNTAQGPPVTRSDWVVCDATGCIYVTGPSKLSPTESVGARVAVVGLLRKTDKGQVYLILDTFAPAR